MAFHGACYITHVLLRPRPQLAGVSGILCLLGAASDKQTIANTSWHYAKSIAHNWVELLAGTLLWKYPTLQPQLHLKTLVARVKAAGVVARQSDEEFLDFFEQVGQAMSGLHMFDQDAAGLTVPLRLAHMCNSVDVNCMTFTVHRPARAYAYCRGCNLLHSMHRVCATP
jgi:hypothetical protein